MDKAGDTSSFFSSLAGSLKDDCDWQQAVVQNDL